MNEESVDMKKVAVMLSSYNGEKYIGKQIESILSQSYPNVELYIRDDGSTDNTVNVIQDFVNRFDNVFLIESDKNLGYPGCFYALTDDESIQADYYAFADQDDYWLKDKISRAVSILEEQDNRKPYAYYARYMVCNEGLKAQKKSPAKKSGISFAESLFEVCGLEFTQVVNQKAMELIRTYKPKKASARGTWMSPLLTGLGTVIFDDYCCAYYRRHECAVTNSDTGLFGVWIWMIKEFFFGGFDAYRVLLEDFNEVVGPHLSKKNKKLIQLFSAKKTIGNQIKKVFYFGKLRSRWIDEIALRIMFLFGRL